MSGVHAKFEQHDIDGKRTGFVVTPARSYSRKLAIVVAIAFAFAVFSLIRVEGNDLLGTIRLVIMIVGGWWVGKFVYKKSEIVAGKLPGGQFVASYQGIELPDGTFIPRDDIQRVLRGSSNTKGRFIDISSVIEVETTAGTRWIVGGLDFNTANNLLEAVIRALCFKVINANSPEALSAGMKNEDLLLTEVGSEKFEVQRLLNGGVVVLKRPTGDFESALAAAREVAGFGHKHEKEFKTSLWISKLADRGAPPVLVPRDLS